MDKNFSDLLFVFNALEVRYLVVGGYAYARYTEPRATKDINLFIRPDPENALSVYKALAAFGAPLHDIAIGDFAIPGTIFQIGVAPFRIDILNQIDGVTFDEAWAESETSLTGSLTPIRYISFNHLIANKLASGRPQDLLDVANLQKAAKQKKKQTS